MKRLLLSVGTVASGFQIHRSGMMFGSSPPGYVQTLRTQKTFWKGLNKILDQSDCSNIEPHVYELEKRMRDNPNFFIWAHADKDFCTTNLTKHAWQSAEKYMAPETKDGKTFLPNNQWFLCLKQSLELNLIACQADSDNECTKRVKNEALMEMKDFVTTQEAFATSSLDDVQVSPMSPEFFMRGAMIGAGSALLLTAPFAGAVIGSGMCLASITKMPKFFQQESESEWKELYDNLPEKKRYALNEPL